MNHPIMQRVMWAAFRGSFQDALKAVLSAEDPAGIMRRSKGRYFDILRNIPDFARGDGFYINILSSAAFAAIMLELPELPALEAATRFYEQAMVSNPFMRMAAKGEDYYTERGRRKLKRRAAMSREWYDANPYTWVFTYREGPTLDQYTVEFTTCGICRMMNDLGLSKLTPALCHYDYPMNALNNTVFSRQYTLAGGGPMCDCHYDHKR